MLVLATLAAEKTKKVIESIIIGLGFENPLLILRHLEFSTLAVRTIRRLIWSFWACQKNIVAIARQLGARFVFVQRRIVQSVLDVVAVLLIALKEIPPLC